MGEQDAERPPLDQHARPIAAPPGRCRRFALGQPGSTTRTSTSGKAMPDRSRIQASSEVSGTRAGRGRRIVWPIAASQA